MEEPQGLARLPGSGHEATVTTAVRTQPAVVLLSNIASFLVLKNQARLVMMRPMLGRLLLTLILSFVFDTALRGQPTQTPSSADSATVAGPTLDYPDSTSGLERLVSGILTAQKTNDGARAEYLLKSMVLPDPQTWYVQAFGENVGREPEAQYEKSASAITPALARYFLDATAQNLTEVRVVRFDKSCDDNAGEDAFGILHARLEPAPLYELRLLNGNKFLRLLNTPALPATSTCKGPFAFTL